MTAHARRATFKVVGSFELSSPSYIVIYGDILDGVISAGMRIFLDRGKSPAVSHRIHGVEFVDGTPTGSHLALTIKFEDDEQLEMLRGLDIDGELLHIQDENRNLGEGDRG